MEMKNLAIPLFMAGLGAGVAVGMLLAPRSGQATRKLIVRAASDSSDWVKDKADSVRTQGADLKQRAKDVVDAVTRTTDTAAANHEG